MKNSILALTSALALAAVVVVVSTLNPTTGPLTRAYAEAPRQAQATPPSDRRTVTVVGMGKATSTPDIARVTLGVEAVTPKLSTGLSDVNKRTTDVIAALKKAGVADKDIRTVDFSIYPQQSYGPNGPGPITGYRVANSVRVTMRDLAKVGTVLDTATESGANTVNSLAFALENDATVQTEARTAAVKDARSKAETLAKEAGASIDQVWTITEAVTSNPYPVMQFAAMAAAPTGGGAQIAPGVQDVNVQVQVTYVLK